MAGQVFWETLRKKGVGVLAWGGGLMFLALIYVSVMVDIDTLREYARLTETLPPALMRSLGMDDAAVLATPEGYLSFAFSLYTMFILTVYGVLAGLDITANEEEAGIMEIVLSAPVPRWRVIAEKFAARVVMICGIALLAYLGLRIATNLVTIAFTPMALRNAAIILVPPTVLVMALTLLLTTVIRRRAVAGGVAAAVMAGSYILNAIGDAASTTVFATLKQATYWHHYDALTALTEGLNAASLSGMLLVALAALLLSVVAFQRRDVGL